MPDVWSGAPEGFVAFLPCQTPQANPYRIFLKGLTTYTVFFIIRVEHDKPLEIFIWEKQAVKNSSLETGAHAFKSNMMLSCTAPKRRSNCRSSWVSWVIYPANRLRHCHQSRIANSSKL